MPFGRPHLSRFHRGVQTQLGHEPMHQVQSVGERGLTTDRRSRPSRELRRL